MNRCFHSSRIVCAIFVIVGFFAANDFGQAAAPNPTLKDAPDETTPCGAFNPTPAKTKLWAVTFCNRTGHKLLLQVYGDGRCSNYDENRTTELDINETKVIEVCYIKPDDGSPGFVTNEVAIIGDCGDDSTSLFQDAATEDGTTVTEPEGGRTLAGQW